MAASVHAAADGQRHGDILALTVMLETGDIRRFATVGDFASYCRGVASQVVAHQLARASYYVLRDRVPFEVAKACA